MRDFKFKLWEKILILLSILFFSLACLIYVTDFPLRKYIFNLTEDSNQVVIGEIITKTGSLRRQISGQSEFKNIESHDPVYNMDVIVTGPLSEGRLRFGNNGSADLGPNTMVRLAFQTDFSLGSISRESPRLEVVTGKVTGKAGKHKLVIKSQGKILTIKPNTVQTTIVKIIPTRPSPRPAPTLSFQEENPTEAPPQEAEPSPSPSPEPLPTISATPTFTSEEAEKTKILYPKNGDLLEVAPFSPKPMKTVKFQWQISPSDRKARVTVWKIAGALSENNSHRTELFHRTVEPNEGKAQTSFTLDMPGSYEWEITGTEGEVLSIPENTHGTFTLNPQFKGIKLLNPLVSGESINSNKLTENLLADFSMKVHWKSYEGARKYYLWFGRSPTSKKSLFEKTVEDPEFIFNKDKILTEQIYYKVTSILDNGFIVSSPIEPLTFNYLPPTLVLPTNNSLIKMKSIQKNSNRILLTWQKTNFTPTYEVEVSRDAGFTQIAIKRTLKDNYFILTHPPHGVYWWRVRSISKDISSPMSSPYSFSVVL